MYLVISEDPVPRLQFQNLCRFPIDVVEAGARGIHAVPWTIQPGHTTVYEPPTMAKVYPMVLGGEGETEQTQEIQETLRSLSIKLRDASDKLPGHINLSEPISPLDAKSSLSRSSSSSSLASSFLSGEDWSGPVSLQFKRDETIQFASMRKVFLTSHCHTHTLHVTILPSGDTAPMCPIASSSDDSTLQLKKKQNVTFLLKLQSASLMLQDTDENRKIPSVENILSLTSSNLSLLYRDGPFVVNLPQDHGKMEIICQKLQIDNELTSGSCEYRVIFASRSSHEWQASPFEEDKPLLQALLIFHCSPLHCIKSLRLKVQPATVQLEDEMISNLKETMNHLSPSLPLPRNKPQYLKETVS